MKPTNPYFTIVIPTYNRANLIGRTLQSVLAQTFLDYEVLVVDDGGQDNTEEVVKRIGSEKVTYLRKENGERGAARNFGWEKASGQYVTFLDSDDVIYLNHFSEAYQFLYTKNCVFYAQAYEIKEALTGTLLVKPYRAKKPTVNEALLKGNFLSCFGVFVKRDLQPVFRFEEDRRFAGTEDWLLWLQLAAAHPLYYNNTVTGAMLEHNSRSVLSFAEESLLYRAEFLKKKLEADTVFLKTYGIKWVAKIYAHMLSYTSLHLAILGKKKKAIFYFGKSIKANVAEVFTRRTLAIAKNIVF